MKRILLIISAFPTILLCDLDTPIETIHTGNFSHKRSPTANFSFGQNIIPKKSIVVYSYFSQLKGKNQNDLELLFEFIYGITDRVSILAFIPLIVKIKSGDLHGRGIGDCALQAEYAWYSKTSRFFQNQSTIVANITVPTARISHDSLLAKFPPVGYGAVTFFLGATASHTSEKWYVFISDGGTVTLEGHDGNKVGNSFYYQGGFGRFLGTLWGFTVVGMIEIDGIWAQKNKICSISNQNSGGNALFMGPVLFLGGDTWTFQGGVEFPALQRLNGIQAKQKFITLISLSYQF